MLLITGALLAGCGELTVEDPRGTVAVKPGQEFVLDFPTNPSVGYDWRLDSQLGPGGPVGYLSYGNEPEDGHHRRRRAQELPLRGPAAGRERAALHPPISREAGSPAGCARGRAVVSSRSSASISVLSSKTSVQTYRRRSSPRA